MIIKNQCITEKINLFNFDRKTMYSFFNSIQERSFRADQVMRWIYYYFCDDFNKMTNLTYKLRNKLNSLSCIQAPTFIEKKISQDSTIKWTMSLHDGNFETIFIPEKKRNTLCISSQIGCLLNCQFCATGKKGFYRNLSVAEIIGQIWKIYKLINDKKNIFYSPITNIVFMGMGEPLLNFNNVIKSLNIIFDKYGLNISKKRIVLSTAGIVPGIKKLSSVIDVKLAISLHAPNDTLRNQLVPINKKYNISMLLHAVSNFLKTSKLNKKGITIEYVMLNNINDTILHAKELIKILKNIPSKINLIPWNYLKNSVFQCSSLKKINKFSEFLNKKGFTTTIRKSRGKDIHAACGQLIGDFKKNNI
ncbi:23S rRNA (adenine(2503)-C(2))-methyltransferase RlmN [Buchnera aphidicola]|uniref:23S rRNA (adenine(2503)-C(2))-methyltransferase RlmN n=1 Tax=Buchnera aphidicola TaxID=9 RepID=UPI003D18C3B4